MIDETLAAQIARETLKEKGRATTVKIALIGRPGKVIKKESTVITSMVSTLKQSGFPKGVPTPPLTPTTYTVYIGAKQWRRVERAIRDDKEDALVIEGECAYDPELGGMAVFAKGVTTKGIQRARREAQQREAEQND